MSCVTTYDSLYFVQHHFPRTSATLLIALGPVASFISSIMSAIFLYFFRSLKTSETSEAKLIYKKSPTMRVNLTSNHFNKIIVIKFSFVFLLIIEF